MKKNKDDLFSEKSPQNLNKKILESAQNLLLENRNRKRRYFFKSLLGSSLTAAASVLIYFNLKSESEINDSFAEIIPDDHIVHDLIAEDDLDLFTDIEVLENLDILENMEDETEG